MPYGSGNLIKSEHINEFVHNTNLILGSGGEDFNGNPDDSYGYHLSTTSFSVSAGDVIDSNEWTYLYDTLYDIGQHQGTNIASRNALSGATIESFSDLQDDINSIANNRFNVSNVDNVNIATTTRTDDWVTDLEHSITSIPLSQGNFENTTKFFNRGGSISISVSSSIISFDDVVITPEIYHNTLLANSGEQLIITETSGNYEARVYAEASSGGIVDARLIIEDTRTNPPAKSTDVTSTFIENQPNTSLVSGSPIAWDEGLTFADTITPFTLNINPGTTTPTCSYSATENECTASTLLTASTSDGSGNFSYNWVNASPVAGTIVATVDPDIVEVTNTDAAGTYDSAFGVTVTDNDTGQEEYDEVLITFTHEQSESVNVEDATYSAVSLETGQSTSASVIASFRSDGVLQITQNSDQNGQTINDINEQWVTFSPNGQVGFGDDFEIRATQTSGDTISGTFGSWEALSQNREWSMSASTGGGSATNNSGTMTVEIREIGTTTVSDSASITLSAIADGS